MYVLTLWLLRAVPCLTSFVAGNKCLHDAGCNTNDAIAPQASIEDETVLLQTAQEFKRLASRQMDRSSVKSKEVSCKLGYAPGVQLIQLPEIQRQFLLVVPREVAQGASGIPLVMHYHGMTDSPWYSMRQSALSNYLESYGWLGILPFGLNAAMSNGMNGTNACCPVDCQELCCKNGLKIMATDDNACRFDQGDANLNFTEALVQWAVDKACVDPQKVFASGFSNGAEFVNYLGCYGAQLFRALAPISGDRVPAMPGDWIREIPGFFEFCKPQHPFSYISMCGTLDDASFCNNTVLDSVRRWSQLQNCTGQGPAGAPIYLRKSATTRCVEWNFCRGGNFVEMCENIGMDHSMSGHLRPDGTSYLRPASDVDVIDHVFRKFSIFVNGTMLFYGHPTPDEINAKKDDSGQWLNAKQTDHMYLRNSRRYGEDIVW